jgi:hypothetical protein
MDAKALGDEYNKTHPPKTVDVLQASVLQFPNRKGSPLFCVENLIEGDYLKYNSNSGFVNAGEEIMRFTPQVWNPHWIHTGSTLLNQQRVAPGGEIMRVSTCGIHTVEGSAPTISRAHTHTQLCFPQRTTHALCFPRTHTQAFSHYTFELTHGYKICVDVQGVGDLYTDPQVIRRPSKVHRVLRIATRARQRRGQRWSEDGWSSRHPPNSPAPLAPADPHARWGGVRGGQPGAQRNGTLLPNA